MTNQADNLEAAVERLEPCPFCGTQDFLRVCRTGSAASGIYPHAVCCHHLDCDEVKGPVGNGRFEAVASWNARALSSSNARAVAAEEAHKNCELCLEAAITSGKQEHARALDAENEANILAVLLDNVVVAQSLSKELRESAHDQARSYLYDRRHRARTTLASLKGA